MGSAIKLPCIKRLVRGTFKELKKYCKDKNIANRHIKQDEIGYFLKAMDRGKLHKR